MTDGRLRVILAGTLYPQPEGLRLFLEESGFEVSGEVRSPGELFASAGSGQPDLVVVGPDLLEQELIRELRAVAPGIGIVAVAQGPPPKGLLAEGDGYVPQGSSLTSLTTELSRVAVASARPAATRRRWLAGARPAAAAGRVGPIAASIAILAGAWILVATFPEGTTPPLADVPRTTPASVTPTTPTSPVPTSPNVSPLEGVQDALDGLIEAIQAGDFDRASAEAEALVRERDAAVDAGVEVGPLEATATRRLATLVPDLPRAVVTQLRAILGDLMPPAEGQVLVAGDGTFGEVPVGTTSGPRPLVISNVGESPLTVVAVDVVGGAGQFSRTSECLGTVLQGERTCTVDVSFRPAAAGSVAAQLRIEVEGGAATAVALNGVGVLVAPPDTEPPILVCDPVGTGWSGSDVLVTCTARDVGSGLAQPADAAFALRTSTADGVETENAHTDARTVCDRERNCITVGPIGGIKIDKRAPDVSCDRPDGGWHAEDVRVPCTARDRGSGVGADASFTLSTHVASGVETDSARTGTRSVCDRVGNCSTAGPIGGI
ncbi:MAG TPA: choice-of-anchor D domain-containing protein, partial [Actinomycetota bacterium]|nr:choice-of-anchor D domain-containing protein [Actinomycetota bacterium]